MLHENLVFIVGFDSESGVWNVSVKVMGIEVWLAAFRSKEVANGFINVFVSKLSSDALFFTEYSIISK